MRTFVRPVRRTGAVIAIAGSLVLAGCGGAATVTEAPATPAPATPAITAPPETAAPTPSPTVAPTEAPTEAPTAVASGNPAGLGGFAFGATEVLDYYTGTLGFECRDPQPSTQAADYTIVRCFREPEDGPAEILALVVTQDGVIGNAFAGSFNAAGEEPPDAIAAIEHLGGFVGAMLGNDLVDEAGPWLGENLGQDVQRTFGDILVLTYPVNDDTGAGFYVEVANDAFMSASAP